MQVLLDDVKDRRRRRIIIEIDPRDRGNSLEKGDLSLGVPSGIAGDQSLRFREIRLVPPRGGTDFEELPIPDGLHPRVVPMVARRDQPFHFPGQPGGKHGRNPTVDPPIEVGAVTPKADHRRPYTGPALPRRAIRREGASRRIEDLQRPENPVAVVLVDSRRSFGIDPGELGPEGCDSLSVQTGLELIPEFLVYPGRTRKTEEIPLKIERGPPRKDRGCPAAGNLPDEPISLLHKPAHVPPFPGVEDVDQVVRYRRALLAGRLGCPDIETTIHLAGIGGDYFERLVREMGRK